VPADPTSSAEKSNGENNSRVCAAMPAAVPTAIASVGDTPARRLAIEGKRHARKWPGKIARRDS